MRRLLKLISSITLGALIMVSCEKSEADQNIDEAKRVLSDASGTEWVGTDDDMVYTLTLNTGGTYRIASTTSANGTYQQNGRNITFEKRTFMSDFYAYIEKGTISESGLYMTVPIKSVVSVDESNDMFTIKLYRKL